MPRLEADLNIETIEKAKQGDADTLFEIGELYCKKWNSNSKGMAWYQLAANKNHARAKNNIGYMLHEGQGVPEDYHSAMKWFVRAAKDGHDTAIYNVGECFEKGHGIPVDKVKALEWYSRINTHSPDVTRISLEGFTLTNEQKEKPFSVLVAEAEQLLEFEEAKVAAISNIESLQLTGPGKSYKIQIEIQPNDDDELEAENRTLRDTCKQQNVMLEALQRTNEYMLAQIDNGTSDSKIKQLEHENGEMKSKINRIEKLLQGITKCSNGETMPDGTDNNDLCYDG